MLRALGRTLLYWLPLAFALTVVCALVHLAVQQAHRTSANDPQVQLAEDAAAALAGGAAPRAVTGPPAVQIGASLAPFVLVYDGTGRPLAGSGVLDGQIPTPPPGVFDEARRENGQDRFTWQPRRGVRIAAVVAPVGGGQSDFVLAGRSLREVEKREAALGAWLIALSGSLLLTAAGQAVIAGVRAARRQRRAARAAQAQ